MIYLFIRIIILLIFFAIFVLFTKNKIHNKRKFLISIIVFILTLYILLLIPFENAIINFQTSEEAFNYSYVNQNILQNIQSSNCSFIVYGKDGSSVSYCTLSKHKDGWKIESPYVVPSEQMKTYDKYFITTINNKESNKKLIVVSSGNLEKPISDVKIGDNKSSQFQTFYSKYQYINYYSVFYYTMIDSQISDYQIFINGQSINLS